MRFKTCLTVTTIFLVTSMVTVKPINCIDLCCGELYYDYIERTDANEIKCRDGIEKRLLLQGAKSEMKLEMSVCQKEFVKTLNYNSSSQWDCEQYYYDAILSVWAKVLVKCKTDMDVNTFSVEIPKEDNKISDRVYNINRCCLYEFYDPETKTCTNRVNYTSTLTQLVQREFSASYLINNPTECRSYKEYDVLNNETFITGNFLAVKVAEDVVYEFDLRDIKTVDAYCFHLLPNENYVFRVCDDKLYCSDNNCIWKCLNNTETALIEHRPSNYTHNYVKTLLSNQSVSANYYYYAKKGNCSTYYEKLNDSWEYSKEKGLYLKGSETLLNNIEYCFNVVSEKSNHEKVELLVCHNDSINIIMEDLFAKYYWYIISIAVLLILILIVLIHLCYFKFNKK